MTYLITNCRCFTPSGFVSNRSVLIDEGRVQAIFDSRTNSYDPKIKKIDFQGDYLLPGFIDLQVNGGGGVLFNNCLDIDGLRQISAAHRKFGTIGFLPTLISEEPEAVAIAIECVREAINQKVPGILGIHIEGPFLNRVRSGIHAKERFRALDSQALGLIRGFSEGVTLVTLAPEQCAAAHISQLAESGVIVAAGHSDATYDEAIEAFCNGVAGVTHIYNAMSPLGSRAPGLVGAALTSDDTWCSMILDGIHIHPSAAKLAVRAKPTGKMILVTDAMATVGSDIDSFEFNGEIITVKDGKCQNAEGTLAGSCLDMATAVKNAVRLLDVPLELAVMFASTNPAIALGLGASYGRVEAGYIADLLRMDSNLNLKPIELCS